MLNWSLLLKSLVLWYGGIFLTSTPNVFQKHDLGAMAPAAAPVKLGIDQTTVSILLNKDAARLIDAALASKNTNLVLTVGGIEFEKPPEIHYQLYANLPAKEKPNYKSAYFIGILDFFGLQHHNTQAERAVSVDFDIKRTIRELKSRKLWDNGKVSVTFVMTWLEDRTGHALPVPPGVRATFKTLTVSVISSESAPNNVIGAR